MEKTKYELRDELIDMWCHAMCCVGTSYSEYEELKKQFMITLGEFEEKVKEGVLVMDIGSGTAYPSEFCGRLMKLRMGKKLEEE